MDMIKVQVHDAGSMTAKNEEKLKYSPLMSGQSEIVTNFDGNNHDYDIEKKKYYYAPCPELRVQTVRNCD